MQNFMKTILSAVQTWTKGKIKDSTADWNQNDSNADNYVKNRTHYDSRYTETITCTFDGNIEGKEAIDLGSGVEYFVKISDDAPVSTNLIGARASVYENGNTINLIVEEGDIIQLSNELYTVYEDVVVALNDTEFDGISFTKGIWTICIIPEGVPVIYFSKLSYNIIHGELKKLDPKYLNLPTNVATIDDVENAKQDLTDTKMDKSNPVGTGSFSMNRNQSYNVGEFSYAVGSNTAAIGNNSNSSGLNTIASRKSQYVIGEYNINEDIYPYYVESLTRRKIALTSPYIYAGTDYSVDEFTGKFTLNNATKVNISNYSAIRPSKKYFMTNSTVSNVVYYADMCTGYAAVAPWFISINGEQRSFKDGTSIRGSYVHIVGNGTSDTERSNAHTLDWNGVAWYQGGIQVGGNAQDDGAKNVLLEGDAIPVPTTATVGQILAVKAVDENGKPTEWEVVDMSGGTSGSEFILNSSTADSTKKFKLTIDDDGVLTATEVVEATT